MAQNTNTSLRNKVIYSIFVRNFTEEGTFQAVIPELDRIKKLGTDIIWFLPFYPIGEAERKGTIGSPYAIKDYRKVDSSHGTMDDFKQLTEEIHQRGMKVMIDIVFNHTSPDSVLAEEHPEWFYKTPEGKFGNRVGDWTDIIDLDYGNQALWDYQIETLKQWAEIVDGFRCDVAPLVPIEFWLRARETVSEVSPGHIWLSESVHPGFIRHLRYRGILAQSDSEIYQAFDMAYDYDIHDEFEQYINNQIPLSKYIYRMSMQDFTYPWNYVKLRHLENHDHVRATELIPSKRDLLQWTAFFYVLKGATLIYNGQEVMSEHTPSLFNEDKIDWSTGEDISNYMAKLAEIKKTQVPMDNELFLEADDENETVILRYDSDEEIYLSVFNLKEKAGSIFIGIPDGKYTNIINNKQVEVHDSKVNLTDTPLILVK